MGTVHAKVSTKEPFLNICPNLYFQAEENFTEAPTFANKNVPPDPADAYTFKEIDLEAVRVRSKKKLYVTHIHIFCS